MNAQEFEKYKGKSVLLDGEIFPIVGYDPNDDKTDLVIGIADSSGWEYNPNVPYHLVIMKKSISYWFADKTDIIND